MVKLKNIPGLSALSMAKASASPQPEAQKGWS